MLRSMTTYSRVESSEAHWKLSLELKSVNNRYCDVNIRLPRWMNGIEEKIKKIVRSGLERGRIDLFINYEGEGASKPVFEPDIELGLAYVNAVKWLAGGLGIKPDLDISTLLSAVKDVIRTGEEPQDLEVVFDRLEPWLASLLDQAVEMASIEGGRLEEDIIERLKKIEEFLRMIGEKSSENIEISVNTLKERVARHLEAIPVDENRIAQEIVILTDRLDITEEKVRAESHLKQFRDILDAGGSVGRKLDFLLQELFREVNTMASKSSNQHISQWVVEIKTELEKIREQVQNVV